MNLIDHPLADDPGVFLAGTVQEVADYVTADPDSLLRAYAELTSRLAEQFGLTRVAAHAQVASLNATDPARLWPHLESLILAEMVSRQAIVLN